MVIGFDYKMAPEHRSIQVHFRSCNWLYWAGRYLFFFFLFCSTLGGNIWLHKIKEELLWLTWYYMLELSNLFFSFKKFFSLSFFVFFSFSVFLLRVWFYLISNGFIPRRDLTFDLGKQILRTFPRDWNNASFSK